MRSRRSWGGEERRDRSKEGASRPFWRARSSAARPRAASEAIAGAPRIWAVLTRTLSDPLQGEEARDKGTDLHRLDGVERALNSVDLLPSDRMRQRKLVDDLDCLRLVERAPAGDAERAEDGSISHRGRSSGRHLRGRKQGSAIQCEQRRQHVPCSLTSLWARRGEWS